MTGGQTLWVSSLWPTQPSFTVPNSEKGGNICSERGAGPIRPVSDLRMIVRRVFGMLFWGADGGLYSVLLEKRGSLRSSGGRFDGWPLSKESNRA